MRGLTYEECARWCSAHGYPVTEGRGSPAPAARKSYRRIDLAYPADSGRKVELARAVVRWMVASGDLLIWIADWAVWPSSQHMPLFTRFREAFGEDRPLIEAPGHLINKEQADDATSILAVALLFVWDCHVFTATRGPVFFCSHDEVCSFLVPSDADIRLVSDTFESWLPGRKRA